MRLPLLHAVELPGGLGDLRGEVRRFLPEMWARRMCLSGEPFTAEQLHLEAGGAMVCEPGTCEAAAEAIAGQLAALRPQFVRDAKLQLRR